METKIYRIYGLEGHRFSGSFGESKAYDFSKKNDVRIISIFNSDVLGTNDYSEIVITRNTAKECEDELFGQVNDGFFENCRVGKIEEINEKMEVVRNVYM